MNPTPDYSARLAWARQHEPQLAREIDAGSRHGTDAYAVAMRGSQASLLSTLDQRYREAHAGPPERWGHAELVARVHELQTALIEACDIIGGLGDARYHPSTDDDEVRLRAIADGRR